MSPWMLLLQDFVIGVVGFVAIAAVALWVWATSGCGGGRRDAPRENLVPTLRSALRRRTRGVAGAGRAGDLRTVR